MASGLGRWLLLAMLLGGGGVVTWMAIGDYRQQNQPKTRESRAPMAVPVELAAIRHGPIELRRLYTGTLEAGAEFVVAPKVGGRIERIHADLADSVRRGALVAELDNAEYVQAVNQARADLEVARANLAEGRSGLEIAARELQRIERLQGRGVSSESQYDVAMADHLAKQARLEVAEAQVVSAEAALETARIRLGYTEVAAGWSGGNEERIVGERFVDEGETVSANTPLLSIVELDPIVGVIHVTEKEYARLAVGQSVTLATDAWPDQSFKGRIARISPVFDEASRQARVELEIANRELHLKPGMFIRVAVVLQRAEDALIVPEQALTKREGQSGVFVIDEAQQTAHWRPVTVGIQQDEQLQVSGDGLEGPVVILGQQLLDEGSAILVPAGQVEKNGQADAGGSDAP